MLIQINWNYKLIVKHWVGYGQKRVWPLWSHRTLKLAAFKEGSNGVNYMLILYTYTDSGKLKVTVVIFGLSWSKMGVAFWVMGL